MPTADPDVADAIGRARRGLAALSDVAGGVVVACSGGADSVALLGIVAKAVRDRGRGRGRTVTAVHVDHGLRPESAGEAAPVAAAAKTLGVAFVPRTLSLDTGPGLAARARQARYEALWSVAADVGARILALGHTATDQAETVLLHLCRGAGLSGLAGMAPWGPAIDRADHWVWRPLLDFDRATTRAMCRAQRLAFVDDPTNDDATLPRTRIRHEVLPQLRAIREGVDLAVARAARNVADADAAIEVMAARELTARRRGADGVTSRYATNGWSDVPIAIRRRMIQRICLDAGVPVDGLSMRTLVSIDDAVCRSGAQHVWDLHPRVRLCHADTMLWAQPSPHGPPRNH